MHLRDFRVALRQLASQPAYSAIVIGGLAAAICACFLLLGYVRYSFNYNASVPAREQVYMVEQRGTILPRPEWAAWAPMPLVEVLRKSGLPLTAGFARGLERTARVGKQLQPLALQAVDAQLGPILGLTPLQGDLAGALARPDTITLTRASATRLFGDAEPIGQSLVIDGQILRVAALLPEQPSNSSLQFDGLVGINSLTMPEFAKAYDKWYPAAIFVRTPMPDAQARLEPLLREALAHSPLEANLPPAWRTMLAGRKPVEVRVGALSTRYFDPDLKSSRAGANYGNRDLVLALAGVAMLILLLAATNYVNLASVRTLQRQREVGVRKVMGASNWRLAGQLAAESLLATLLATLLGLLLAWLLTPAFSAAVNRDLQGMFTPLTLLAGVLAGTAVGLLAAAYPAWIAFDMRASVALQGRAGGESAHGLCLRRALTVFQFSVAMGLCATALAVAWQTDYASNAAPGFNPRPLLVLDLPRNTSIDARDSFRERLAHLPGVAGVASVSEAVGRDDMKIIASVRNARGEKVSIEWKVVSPDFFDVYQIAPSYGRLLHAKLDRVDGMSVVLNAAAVEALGFASPQAALGQLTGGEGDNVIVGIAPDLRFTTLRHPPKALMYKLSDEVGVFTIRANGDPAALRAPIEQLWREQFPDAIINLQGAGALFAPNYQEDRRLFQILLLAAALATLLAGFGVYVLSAYNVQRRAREIVLRKLYGAGPRAIGRLLGREFAFLAGAGALLGLPPAALAIERYLSGFAERAPIGSWPLAAATLLAVAIIVLAGARHTVAAMRVPPSRILQY